MVEHFTRVHARVGDARWEKGSTALHVCDRRVVHAPSMTRQKLDHSALSSCDFSGTAAAAGAQAAKPVTPTPSAAAGGAVVAAAAAPSATVGSAMVGSGAESHGEWR